MIEARNNAKRQKLRMKKVDRNLNLYYYRRRLLIDG